jgi:restriction system protein
MRRRRKKGNLNLAVICGGVGAVIILTTIAINNPWSILSLLFVLALLCFAVLGGVLLWKKAETNFRQQKEFKRVSYVRSAPQMAFLTPTDFEHYIAMLFSKLGYKVEVTKQSGDGGVDIILRDKVSTAAVQVKRYLKGSVGRPEIQRLVGASLNKFDKMIFVTTGSYSFEATEYAASHGVELIDGSKLDEMASKVVGKDYINKALSYSILERNK